MDFRKASPEPELVHHPWASRLYLAVEPAVERVVGPHRQHQSRLAAGRVLVLGAGTGLDVPAIAPYAKALTLLEPDPTMRQLLARRHPDVPLLAAVAEDIPAPAAAFDTVVSSLVLCSVTDVDQVLREVFRVLAPGGQFLFLEHVRSAHPARFRVQAALEPAWRRIAGGCHLTRDIEAMLEASPLEVVAVDRIRPTALLPLLRGLARRPA
jgi:SAM-dependent methyltransferase